MLPLRGVPLVQRPQSAGRVVPRLPLLLVVALTSMPAPAVAQRADPKAGFVQALAQFSQALDGAYGDEGPRIASSLALMRQELDRWDALLATYEKGMASELPAAEPQLAARMHLALGAAYLDRLRVEDARRELAAAAQLAPDRAEVQTLLGVFHAQVTNDVAAATAAMRRAAALASGDPVRAYLLARQEARAGNADKASAALQTFQEIWRTTARQPTAAGASSSALFIRVGLVPETSGLEPFFPPVLYAEGFASLARGDLQQALALFEGAAAGDPLNAGQGAASGAIGQAAAAFRDGAVTTARRHLESAVAMVPERAEPRRLLGLVHVADEQFDAGIDALRAAVRLDPRDERARLDLAAALVASDQLPAAVQILRETLTSTPSSGRARYALARVYQRQGLHADAVRELEQAVIHRPLLGLNGIYETIGALESARQNFDAAIAAYSSRVTVQPNEPAAHRQLGDIYLRLGRHDEALAEFIVALMLKANDADAYAAAGQVHLREGRDAEAAAAAQRAVEIDQAHQEARYTLGTALLRLERTDEGRRELAVFERIQAESMAARNRGLELGRLRREAAVSTSANDFARAVALWRSAIEYEPRAAVSHMELGLALVRSGQAAQAIEALTTAASLNAPAIVYRHLAETYAALGQADDSRRAQDTYARLKQEALRRRAQGSR